MRYKMKRFLVFTAMLCLFAGSAMAAENLFGLTQRGPNVAVKNMLGFLPHVVSDNSTAQVVQDESFIVLDNTSALTVGIADVDPGQIVVITQADNGTAGHTVSLPAGMTFNGTTVNATFNSENETLIFMGIADDRVAIIENIGAVGFE